MDSSDNTTLKKKNTNNTWKLSNPPPHPQSVLRTWNRWAEEKVNKLTRSSKMVHDNRDLSVES